jgi:hypothetical protein
MSFFIRFIGRADCAPSPALDGKFVVDFHDTGPGKVIVDVDPRRAKRFDTKAAARNFWQAQSKRLPLRAFVVEIGRLP